jgi:hypothetical protein
MSSGVGCAAYMIFTEAAGTPAASDRTPHTTISKPFHYVGILSLPKESITCSCQDPSIKKIIKFGNSTTIACTTIVQLYNYCLTVNLATEVKGRAV